MLKKLIAVITLAATSWSTQAALVSLPAFDAAVPGSAGALFQVGTLNGVTAALGAQPLTGSLLPNDGVSTFFAPIGSTTVGGEEAANWNLNLVMDVDGYCLTCLRFRLLLDTDPGAGQNFYDTGLGRLDVERTIVQNNMELDITENIVGGFDPSISGIYDYRLFIYDTDDINNAMASSSIRVVVGPRTVPEPAALGLVGVAVLAGALARRRRA
jgi:hypothetical protein